MITLTARDFAYSVFGAFRLARFDAAGLDYFDRTPEGAAKSFYAALVVLPAYAVLLSLRLWEEMQTVPVMHFLVVESIAYVVSWTAFPVAMITIAAMLDRADRYTGFLCAYNWSSVVQMSVYLPAVLLAESALLPSGIAEGVVFGAMMAMLTYQWFVMRTSLDIAGPTAAALLLLDLFLSALITDYADGLL
ncbi:hypothetical protein [Azospirillum halopraeferens]|uniref:hypothetical protein n=1 Tax=Azospirillum halopraeferens TaxID=34010 RepID=UPI000415A84D|nr:hypothetical protein [Azospirillum halopraeferens]